MIYAGGPYWCCEFCGSIIHVEAGVPLDLISCTRCMSRYVDCGDFRLLVKDERR